MLTEILLSLSSLSTVPLTQEVTNLGPHLVWVESRGEEMTLDEVAFALKRGEFTATQSEVPNLGFVHRPVYFVVPVENKSDQEHFVLDIEYPLLDEVSFHLVTDRGVDQPLISGDHFPFAQRYRPHRTINFKLDLKHSERALLIIKVKTESVLQFPLKIYSLESFGDNAASSNLILGLYYGLGLVMIIYNAFLYASLRMPGYLYYVIYLVAMFLVQATIHGIFFQLFVPNNPGISDNLIWFWGSLAWIFSLQFSIYFNDLDRRLPTLARISRIIIGINILHFLLNFFIPYHISLRIGGFLTGAVNTPLLLVIGCVSLYSGYRPARFFLMGWGALMMATFTYSLKIFGIFPAHFLIEYSMLIGSSVEVMLLSLALGDRVNLIQKERDEANHALIDGYSRLQKEIDRREGLEKQKEALAQEIQHATEQLIQADKMSTMGQLVAGVAHDIANPTQLIINSKIDALKTVDSIEQRLNALLEGDDPEVQAVRNSFSSDLSLTKGSLQDISTAVDRIEAIQSAIRNQTRVDLLASPVHLYPLIDECLTILRSKLKPIRIEIQCPEDLILDCRRSQLGQVITNLLSNAADALEEKGREAARQRQDIQIILRAGLEEFAHAGRLIYIEVEDDGAGVPDDKVGEIFKAFFTTKAVGVGTGLGLSICHKIISSHGGSIRLQAARTLQGASFRIELPAVALRNVS